MLNPVHLLHVLHHASKPALLSADRSGSAEKRVTCEFCGTRFNYKVRRAGTGAATTIDLADAKAKGNLLRLLDRAVEPVPCPACGKFQTAMVHLLRRRHLAGMRGDGVAAIALGIGFWASLALIAARTGWPAFPVWPVAATLALLGASLLLLRSYRVRRFDPNTDGDAEMAHALARRLRTFPDHKGPDFVVCPDATVQDKRDSQCGPSHMGTDEEGHNPQKDPLLSVFVGGVLGLPGLVACICFFTLLLGDLMRFEPVKALVVDEGPFKFGRIFRSFDLRHERAGVVYKKSVQSPWYNPSKYEEGQEVDVLLDPDRGELVESRRSNIVAALVLPVLGGLLMALLFRAGCVGWWQLHH
jgi:hypothetical protein